MVADDVGHSAEIHGEKRGESVDGVLGSQRGEATQIGHEQPEPAWVDGKPALCLSVYLPGGP